MEMTWDWCETDVGLVRDWYRTGEGLVQDWCGAGAGLACQQNHNDTYLPFSAAGKGPVCHRSFISIVIIV